MRIFIVLITIAWLLFCLASIVDIHSSAYLANRDVITQSEAFGRIAANLVLMCLATVPYVGGLVIGLVCRRRR